MGKVIMISSLKGGVGKTTVTAALAYKTAMMGYKTLAVDMDFGVRSLDIALGHENSLSPSCLDVIYGKASVSIAADEDEKSKNLYFMSAPMSVDPQEEGFELPYKLFDNFLKSTSKEYDYVFLDMPAGTGKLLSLASRSGAVSTSLIVCTHNTASIRAAEKLGSTLSEAGCKDTKLIINCFEEQLIKKHGFPGIVEIINSSSVPLIGVIPYDSGVEDMLSAGKPVTMNKKSLVGKAVSNIAERLAGMNIPLFEGIMKKKKRLILY